MDILRHKSLEYRCDDHFCAITIEGSFDTVILRTTYYITTTPILL